MGRGSETHANYQKKKELFPSAVKQREGSCCTAKPETHLFTASTDADTPAPVSDTYVSFLNPCLQPRAAPLSVGHRIQERTHPGQTLTGTLQACCPHKQRARQAGPISLTSPYCAQRPTLQNMALALYALAPPSSMQTAV